MTKSISKKSLFIFFVVTILIIVIFSYLFFHQPPTYFADSNKKIILIDNNISFEINSQEKTVAEFIDKNRIFLDNADYLYPAKEASLFTGEQIIIKRANKISILIDNQILESTTHQKTVEEAIQEKINNLNSIDITDPPRESPLYTNMKIKVTRVNIEEKVSEENLAFKTITKYDDQLGWREKKTEQKGEQGIKKITSLVTYHNGKEISRKIIGSEIIKEPVPEIIFKGTFVKTGKLHKGQGTWYDQSPYPNLLARYPFENQMFAANPWLPLGSYAKVTNLDNGKSVIVRINDRGPFGPGRIIDLNKPAFAKIASLGAGIINVKVEEILN